MENIWVAIISGIVAVVVAGINYLAVIQQSKKTRKVVEDRSKLQEEGLKQLLGNAIDDMYFKYKIKGEIPLSARKNLEEIYRAYSALHGNGEREKHYLYLTGLPIVDDI